MTKMFALIPRKDGVGKEEFHDHWRHPHITMGAQIESIRAGVQSHQVESPRLDEAQRRYEAISEVWFDSVSEALTLAEHPLYKGPIEEDELLWVNKPELTWLFVERTDLLADRPDTSRGFTKVDALWREDERPVSTKIIQFLTGPTAGWASSEDAARGDAVGAFRHVRSYTAAEVHGDDPTFSGVRELWWPTRTAFESGVERDPDSWKAFLDTPDGSITVLCWAERWR